VSIQYQTVSQLPFSPYMMLCMILFASTHAISRFVTFTQPTLVYSSSIQDTNCVYFYTLLWPLIWWWFPISISIGMSCIVSRTWVSQIHVASASSLSNITFGFDQHFGKISSIANHCPWKILHTGTSSWLFTGTSNRWKSSTPSSKLVSKRTNYVIIESKWTNYVIIESNHWQWKRKS